MNMILEELRTWGCDVAGALERMIGDEAFYVECLQEVAKDPSFDKLKEALETGDGHAAFEAAHTLKGVLANVGLTPMYNKITEIVEPLRAGHQEGLLEQYAQLDRMRTRLIGMLPRN